ncbi:MAG TPA: hypothetical protein VKB41_12335 [Steroidobacteraceae bacterium]|jgi:hypothetical protein|nr:hypothetical protein [Steroidobacteraceae bacterium]
MKADPALLYTQLQGAPEEFQAAAREHYREDVQWSAPARGLLRQGRESLIAQLLGEAAAMQDPTFTRLRCSNGDAQCIDEYAVRFTCGREGIDGVPVAVGDLVELKRVRILELLEGKVAKETSIETWSVLSRD